MRHTDRRNSARYSRHSGTRRRVLTACAGVLGALLLGAATAQPPQNNLVAQPRVSLQQAVDIATRSRPGRVVRAVTVEAGGGRQVHEVRILQSEGGRVVTVRVDAQTGRVR